MSPPRPEVSVAVDFFDECGSWDGQHIEAVVRWIVSTELGSGDYAIAVHLVDDDAIRALNAEHRGIAAATDVLSFSLHDASNSAFVVPPGQPVNLGDIVVSHPRAVAQAAEYGHSVDRELAYLVAHGVLHVLGYDHEDEAERLVMRQKEEEALAPLGLTR
jgi:probable rRNA maturation factor